MPALRCLSISLFCLCLFGIGSSVLASEEPAEQDLRAEIAELKKQKRLDLVEMIVTAKQTCQAAQAGSDVKIRECFRSQVKSSIKEYILRDREAKKQCRSSEEAALHIQLCALKAMSGTYLTIAQTLDDDAQSNEETAFRKSACPFETTDSAIECGYVTVPLNRSVQNSKTIDLAVAVLQKKGKESFAEPLFFLEGGPGGESLSSADIWVDSVFRQHRDIVLFDQRGTGFSEPKLECPGYEVAYSRSINSTDTDGMMEDEAKALQACFQKYERQGINFAAFNSIEGVQDINAIRQALGYDKIDLLGISYGSRLALTAMRDNPNSINSVVIESVLPLEESMFADTSEIIGEIFQKIFEKCREDNACAEAFPDFEQDFDKLFLALEQEPVAVAYTRESTGETVDLMMGVPQLATAVYRLIASSEGISYLPLLVDIAMGGNYEPFAMTLVEIEDEISRQIDPLVNFATLCNEEYFAEQNPTENKSSLGFLKAPIDEFTSTYDIVCSEWKYRVAENSENTAILSDIPTLILSGEFDPITPQKWAEATHKNLKNSIQLVFPVGHGELTAFPGCGADIAASFFDDPLKKPEIACMDEIAAFKFVTE